MSIEENAAHAGIAEIARSRSAVWRLVSESLAPPIPEFTERLRQGAWQEELRSALAWLGDAADPIQRAVSVLDVLARRSERRSFDDERAALVSAWVSPVADVVVFSGAFTQLADLCEQESAAWFEGDLEQAKAHRRAEFTLVEEKVVPTLPEWYVVVDEQGTTPTYLALARIAVGWLSVESGRDFDRALLTHDS